MKINNITFSINIPAREVLLYLIIQNDNYYNVLEDSRAIRIKLNESIIICRKLSVEETDYNKISIKAITFASNYNIIVSE